METKNSQTMPLKQCQTLVHLRKTLTPKVVTLLLILLMTNYSHAQKKDLDSLLNLLSSATDKKRICELHSKLSAKYKVIDPEKGIKYGKLAREEATNLNWNFGLAQSHYELGSNYRIIAKYPEALKCLFTALKYAERILK